ncbi:succinic semialdehyde dehydrogenase [Pengzhenrongella frigida]|uniref:Succinate-semialdehyde dehydrogenase (NADP(+)) n=1 Tax=Pengzhenrongella frigida TaxID=1259133 RepID=A0A4Q5N249_9MICO|nr:succinic semialdehyde dehydrogenase [Cellulomonas sp. HLT2-17]RYV52185.1 succinate-semialdehyde dehydrogenase (NADP(+)) [Cellulomonas sp. HLT2-17]
MASDPHAHQLIDPETDPRATYMLEPDDVRGLLARIAVSPGTGTVTTFAPFTGGPLAAVPLSTPDDVARAAGLARAAQRPWALTPVAERAAVLLRLHDLVLANQSDVLDLIQLESGKSRAGAFEEVADVALIARHFGRRAVAYLAPRRVPGLVPLLTGVTVLRHPVGVVGVISPWNYPLALSLGDVLPALVAGNAVLLKPDTQTALTALWGVEQLEAAGLPAGLLQVVVGNGAEVGAAVVDAVDHVCFTGSTAVGRVVAARAGGRLIGASLELGGKNPMYVTEDVDIDVAAEGAARSCFAGAGQLCVSVERLYVHEDVADEFLAAFLHRVRALALGGDLAYTADVGSLTTIAQLAKVTAHVDDAVARGARVLAGGVRRADLGPLFYAPTVLDGVPADALAYREETFGPVVSVYRVASDDEAVAAMNDTEYGLNASVWTRSAARGRAIAARIESGTVNVNDGYAAAWGSIAAPQGGRKSSGLGARHGAEGIAQVTDAQTIAVQRGAHGLRVGLPGWLPGGPSGARRSVGAIGLGRLYELPAARWTALFTRALRLLKSTGRP